MRSFKKNLLKRSLLKRIERIYVSSFARQGLRSFNNYILSFALKAKGFNNYSVNLTHSGELDVILRVLRLGIDEVFDVGANIGQYSTVFLSNSKARVFAFEPVEKSFFSLLAIREREERLFPFNFALGASEYETNIYFGTDTDELATISPRVMQMPDLERHNIRSAKVEVKTLDSVFLELKDSLGLAKLDCIKIDTEGFELDVLNGSKFVLEHVKPKAIILEWNWHHLYLGQTILSVQECLVNYQGYRILPYQRGVCPVDATRPEENICDYSNYVFIRKDLVGNFLSNG